ncbi:DUF4214 domain-containing protein [Reyranella sp.]|uniref:DUF4214 domain-containing protein n=1 Tax=Reyranella sp. TaxID=1929291 RepID=UPI003D0BEB53
MAYPIDTAQEMIGQLYVGYFGRAADPVGLDYWVTQLNGGMSLVAIANSFAVQPEATALYSYLAAPTVGDPVAFITAIYQDLFNRGPDAAGLAYWVNQLTVQGTPPGQMVLNIISGAQGSDKTTIENKTHVAVDYAQKFVDNNVTWIGIDNIQGARDVVTPVDNTQASVDAAILQIDGIINQELTNPQNIQLTPNFTSIVSGGTVDITVQADPSQANKSFQFNITGIDSSEVKGGALSGTVTLGTDSKAVIHLDTVVTAESLNTANDTIKVSVPGTVQTLFTNVTLTHGVQTVSQPGPVTEGNAFSFTVSTTGIAAGSANGLVQTYTITGPGLAHIPVAERSGTVTLDANGTATVTVNTLATLADVGTTTVTVAVGNDAPVDVVINETAVQTVTASAGTIPEGGSVVFTIKTTGVAGSAVAGQVENWTLSGAASDQINGPLSGTITLDENGTATVTVSTLVNELNGVPLRDLVFTVLSGAVPTASTTIDVSQGTQVTTNTGPVNEGSAFSFTVTTSGVAPGSVEGRIESYTLSGAGIDHIPVAERSGTVVLDANGHAAVTVHTLADLGPLGPDPVTIQVGNNAPITVNIEDTAFQTVTVDATSINQGQSVTFTVNTFGVPAGALAGTQQTWTLSGTGTNQVTGGVLSGVVTLDANNSAVVTVGTDFSIINGPLTQNLVFNLDSGGSTVSSPTVTIHESTLTVTPPALPIVEGNQVTYTITGTNIPNGTTFTYTLSGDAIGNVVPASQINGTVTINNNNATVVINTLSNDPSGLTKGLTLTIDQVPTATGTALIAETAPLSFILTTGTDNFVGNPAGENTFFAVANSNFFAPSSTLGQNDNLNGGSAIAGRPNTLFLQTTGLLPQLINAFTTTDIQVFSINAGQDGDGTTIDMSSVFGLQKVVNANSSGHLTLLNVTSEIDLELLHPSDILGKNVDLIVQYQNNPAKPATQTLTLDPTVSPLTALPIARFWVNVPQVTITSAGPPINGLMSINGAAGPFAATALTTLTMLGGTDFIAGVDGSGQVATAFTGAEVGAAGNLLDLAAFGGIYFNVGDPGDFAGITSVGGLTIRSGPGGIQGIYVPGPGATGAVQVGGGIAVGGNLALNIGDGKISDQSMTIGGSLTALGNPFGAAAGGLLTSTVTTLGGSQTYDGFNGGLSGMLVTNGGSLNIGSPGRVNGTIDVAISTGTGAAVVFGGDGDVTLDFSGAGTTGFHRALAGPGSTDRFYGGSGVNTLIFDPMINNVNGGPNGMGQATGVQNIVLQSPAGTPWDGTAGGAPGNLPTNTVDLGRLNLNAALTGPNPGFPQTIRIDGPLGPTGQTFMGAVSNDVFVLDNNGTAVKGGSMQGQVMAFDFIQATASNAMSLVVDNVNQQDGAPALVLRDFDALSAEAADQDPITTLNLTLNRNAGFPQVSETITLDNLNRLTTLELAGTANNFDDDQGATGLFIDPVGGGGTLTTITGGNANVNIAFLAFDYLSKQGGSIVLGNGANTIGAFAGDWEITFGKVPGGGTAEDSGNSLVYLIPDLGSRHTVRAGGGHDTFVIGRIFASPLQPDGGVVDITAGPGEDWFVFDQSGPFPSITSAQKLDGGVDRDRILLVDGALNENDSLFGQVTSVEELQLAVGKFDNSLLLNFFANQSGLDTIFTTGGGSSNVFFEGTGFTNAVTYRIATGDTGGDAVIVAALPTGSNAITVRSSVTGFDTAFESGLLTKAINPGTGLETPSGIFANPFAANTLELVADGTTANVFGNGTFGVHDVQRIVGVSGGSSAAQTVWLVNDPALFTSTTTIDLGAVEGPTTAYGVGSSLALSITGGQGATNLQGGFAGDTIVAKGTGPGLGSNFLWGAGGGDVVTGVAGGAGNDVGTTFLIDSQFESPGGPQQGPAGIDLTITNFHSDTDTVLINPGALALGDIPVFIGTAADYLGALALLAGGGAAQTQAVFQADIGGTWVDADNNGLLNSLDILWFNLPGFASPGYQPGSTNFGNLLGLFTGAEVTAYIDSKLNPESDLVVSDTLQPGQFLFGGGPGIGDKLTLDGGNVADGVLIGFESLEFADGKVGTLSVKQWNTFNLVPGAITGPGINTARFLDGFGFVSTGMITVAAIENYDFSALSEGILMSTRAFFGMGNPQGPGTATGTAFDDTFNVTDLELKAGFTIDGGGGDDTINVDAVLTFGNSFTQNPAYPAAGSGQTNAVVLNVENLSLLDGFNTVGFNPGTQFVNVIGGAFNDLIINPQNLDPGWFLDVMGNAGLAFPFENVIQVTGQANNLSLGTIQATGGTVSLNIGTPLPTNPSNTTMTFQQYQLFQSSIFNIFLTGGSTFANTTISFVDSVTGAALLDSSVGNWVFSSADDTFTVSPDDGALKQNINIASGGDDTLVFGTGVFSGDLVGAGADDSVVFLAEPTDIKGVNGGGATGAGVAIFNDTPSSVTMTVEQHNGFGAPFNTTGGTQTITLATSGTATGDGGIEHYVLANGDDTFKVAPDSEAFEQTVDVSSGGVDVIQYGSPFSGNLTGAEGDDTVQFLAGGGDVDIAEVNGGAETGAGTASFGNADITVSMTLEQHNGFEPPFIDTDGTQTIVLTTVGVVIGDAGIENYVVIGDGDYTFVLAKDNDGLVGGSQNLDLVDPDVFDDTVVFGPGTFSGMLANAGKGDLVKFSGGATDISGLNGGKATGAEHLGFNGGDPSATLVDATLTVAQHNAFTHPS